jgi:hypothetical protein
MFKNSSVSLGGRLIITAIFVLTIFGPEIFVLITLIQLGAPFGMSFVRLALESILYYFAMRGKGWARWITAFLLITAIAFVIGISGRKHPFIALGMAAVFIPGIAILLGLKNVQPDHRMRSRRRRSHQ